MRCNNKHILEESSEDEKLIGELLCYMNDKIKGDSYKNIMSSR